MRTSCDIILDVIDENVYGGDFRSDCTLSANNSVDIIFKKFQLLVIIYFM